MTKVTVAHGKNKKKLTPKQRMFVKEYLVDLNATQAAIRAGYSKRTASEQSARLLANVKIQESLQIAMNKRSERVEMTADNVLDELKKFVFHNPKNFYDENGKLKNVIEMDDDTAKAVVKHKVVKTEMTEDGKMLSTINIEGIDKLKAIEMAMRHLKLFNDRIEVTTISHEDALAELE